MGDSDELERLKKKLFEYENKLALLSMELQRLKASQSLSNSGYNRMEKIVEQTNNYNTYQDKNYESEDLARLRR